MLRARSPAPASVRCSCAEAGLQLVVHGPLSQGNAAACPFTAGDSWDLSGHRVQIFPSLLDGVRWGPTSQVVAQKLLLLPSCHG